MRILPAVQRFMAQVKEEKEAAGAEQRVNLSLFSRVAGQPLVKGTVAEKARPSLPAGWEAIYHETYKRDYYFAASTGESVWEVPKELREKRLLTLTLTLTLIGGTEGVEGDEGT